MISRVPSEMSVPGTLFQSLRIEGYAIVSVDGMIADRKGRMPDALRIDADQRFFAASLDVASAVAHGRHSHEQQSHSGRRHRLILTRKIAGIEADASNPLAIFWNPAGCSLAQACRSMGVTAGVLAVIGATDVSANFSISGITHSTSPVPAASVCLAGARSSRRLLAGGRRKRCSQSTVLRRVRCKCSIGQPGRPWSRGAGSAPRFEQTARCVVGSGCSMAPTVQETETNAMYRLRVR